MSGDDFPYHRCVDYHVESLPYRLSLPVEEGDDMFCMNFSYVGPSPDPTECYTKLEEMATSISIGVGEFGGPLS